MMINDDCDDILYSVFFNCLLSKVQAALCDGTHNGNRILLTATRHWSYMV